MRLFGGAFDFNRDGEMSTFEKAAQAAFACTMMEEDESQYNNSYDSSETEWMDETDSFDSDSYDDDF